MTIKSNAHADRIYRSLDMEQLDEERRLKVKAIYADKIAGPVEGPTRTQQQRDDDAKKVHKILITALQKVLQELKLTKEVWIMTDDGNKSDTYEIIGGGKDNENQRVISQMRLSVSSAEKKAGYYNNLGCAEMWLNISTGEWGEAEKHFKIAARLNDYTTSREDAKDNLSVLNKARADLLLWTLHGGKGVVIK